MENTYQAKVVILTGNPIERADLGRFVVDLETITTHKDRLSVDFDHDEQTPIGYIENIEFVPGAGLVGIATFSSPNENDKAAEILQRLIDGFPFEVSPTLDMLDPERLEAGEKTEVNGIEVEGELDIYRNVGLRGVGIVLFGTDPNTKVTNLKNHNLITLKNNGVITMTKKLNDDDALVTLDNDVQTESETTETTKPEYLQALEAMIESFGLEAAVGYFRQGLTIEEAEKLDYEELKKLRSKLAEKDDEEAGEGEDGDGDGGTDDGTADEGTDEEEEKKEDLKAELTELKAELTKLRAAFGSRGEDTPVSATKKQEPDNLSPIQKMAEKIKRTGIKRA